MKKVLLLLAALSAISFAAGFEYKDGESTTATINAKSKVEVLEETLTFNIGITNVNNAEISGSEVTFNHGTIQNGVTLDKQGETYIEAPEATITITETTNSAKAEGKIVYGFGDIPTTEDADSITSLTSSFGEHSNLDAYYTLSTESNIISPSQKEVTFTLISSLKVNENITGAADRVYVPLKDGGTTTPTATTISFKYKKNKEASNY